MVCCTECNAGVESAGKAYDVADHGFFCSVSAISSILGVEGAATAAGAGFEPHFFLSLGPICGECARNRRSQLRLEVGAGGENAHIAQALEGPCAEDTLERLVECWSGDDGGKT